MNPTPTSSPGLAYRIADFETLSEGLDYAARSDAGVNFYSARGELLRSSSYRELRETAVALARGLIRAGLPKGARFALLADTTADFMIFFHACQYAGLIPVPLGPIRPLLIALNLRNPPDQIEGNFPACWYPCSAREPGTNQKRVDASVLEQ